MTNNLRHVLKKIGKTLFTSKGFKNVGVREIIALADISIGTFYNYFDSKEDLFFSLFLEENMMVHEQLKENLNELIKQDKDPIEVLKITVNNYYDLAQNNPILKHGFNIEEFIKIANKLKPVQKTTFRNSILGPYMPYLDRWKSEGKIKDIKPEVLIAAIDSITFIYANKNNIEKKLFNDITSYMIESLIGGLRV